MSNIGTIHELQNRNLSDQPNLQTRELYIYKVKNQKDKGFIKEQSIAIINIEFVKKIVAVKDEQMTTITQVNLANNSKGNTASLQPRLGNMAYTTEEHFNEGALYIASFDKRVTINNGTPSLDLFFIDNIRESYLKPRTQHGKIGTINPTDFTLTNINDVTQNYAGLKFLFTFANEVTNPTKLEISVDNYTLLSKIMAKGQVANKKHQDIDLEIDDANSSKLSLITMTPTSTNYKLSMFSHWLDSNRTLAFVKAKGYIAKKNLKDLFDPLNIDFTGWSTNELSDAYKTIIGMMKLTQAYATNFTEYRTATDGKIDGAATINGIKLVDFADKNPVNAIDGMVETWKTKYPGQVESGGFKVMLEIITMLSNHINSTYAISKGLNDFMKVYLPWYFVPQTAINKNLADDAAFEVILKSEYFDFAQTNPLQIMPQYKDISGYIAHDLNGWISQPELPNNLTPINKFSRPGDVSLNSDNDLKYLFYIPFVDESILENIYGEIHSSTTTGWHDEGITRRFTREFNIGLYWYQGQDASVYVKPEGHDGFIERLVRDEGITATLARKLINQDTTSITDQEWEQILSLPVNSRLKPNSIANIVTGGVVENVYSNYVREDDTTYEYSGKRYIKITFDYQLQVDGSTTISSVQHKGTIFDKLNWRSVSNSLTNGEGKYTLSLVPNHKFKLQVNDISELNIQAVWLDYISITITNGTELIAFNDIELPSLEDESITAISVLL